MQTIHTWIRRGLVAHRRGHDNRTLVFFGDILTADTTRERR